MNGVGKMLWGWVGGFCVIVLGRRNRARENSCSLFEIEFEIIVSCLFGIYAFCVSVIPGWGAASLRFMGCWI